MIEQLHIMQNLKFLNYDLVKLETAAFVYNYKSGQLPSTFRSYFTALNNIHVKTTRATALHNFFVPFFKTLKLQRSIKYQGPKIWNSLDLEIKNSKSLKAFKSRLKNLLLASYHSWIGMIIKFVFCLSIKFVVLIFNYLLFIQQDVYVCESF